MQNEKTDQGVIETWSVHEVAQARGNIVLIDVRTPQEYGLERISGALLMPLQEFRPECLPGQEAKRIVLHCGSGMRSGRAVALCLAAGFGRISHMQGGLAAWKDAGLEYIGTDLATGAPKAMRKEG